MIVDAVRGKVLFVVICTDDDMSQTLADRARAGEDQESGTELYPVSAH
jgi:hypothetical protein